MVAEFFGFQWYPRANAHTRDGEAELVNRDEVVERWVPMLKSEFLLVGSVKVSRPSVRRPSVHESRALVQPLGEQRSPMVGESSIRLDIRTAAPF
ncbi:hypothetical protein HSRCO_2243 [Halanaeroarchaeum sp. HSR-CO]|nr:hypothetical protein HSRCO_2243 [Halanaeroarchaeum sp. HSR-CO]